MNKKTLIIILLILLAIFSGIWLIQIKRQAQITIRPLEIIADQVGQYTGRVTKFSDDRIYLSISGQESDFVFAVTSQTTVLGSSSERKIALMDIKPGATLTIDATKTPEENLYNAVSINIK